jgi:hypothetical protein
MWNQTRYALEFFHIYLPFWEMIPDNGLTTAAGDYCFADPGHVYAVYLPNGGTTDIDLGENNAETFLVKWYNPRAGGELLSGTIETVGGAGKQSIGMPHSETDMDWLVLIKTK